MSQYPSLKRLPVGFATVSARVVAGAMGVGALSMLGFAIGGMAILPLGAQAQGMAGRDSNGRLSAALIRLNHNPRDAEALTAAGNAALATGDTDAALGFFTRALRLSPDNAQIEAGLAGAEVHAEDPFSAIPLFLAAEKSGPIAPELLGDRGLAYDLIGDNANAQQYYRQALGNGPPADVGAEVSRRLAISLAIGGDRRASEAVLSALLQKQDRAAWRSRVFALAILGYEEEAVATARATMPATLALEIAPYLRYMRRLTPAQQAAAANLGHFPQAADIGQDDPRVAEYARTLDRSRLGPAVPAADRALVPAGAPFGRPAIGTTIPAAPAAQIASGKRRKAAAQPQADALAAHAATAARPVAEPAGNPAPPELFVSRDTQPGGPSQLAPMSPPPPPVPLEVSPTPQPMGSPGVWHLSAPVEARQVDQPLPATALQASAARPAPHTARASSHPSFSEAFAALSPTEVDITPERGAVDLRKIKPARALPPPPPPPSHPSRIWVELGVGRDTDRIAFDWRRMVKDDPEIFRGKKPYVSGWARTNRLLVGPFETDKAANAFTEKLHRADHTSAFVWTSPAGQVVDPLDQP